MNLTRKQQMYFGILGLGLFVLILDRTVLAPDEAEARPTPTQTTPHVDPVADSSSVGPGSSNGRDVDHTITVSQQLRRLAERHAPGTNEIRDAFAPSEVWFSVDGSTGRKTPEQIVREFKQHNQLLGVLFSRGQSKAMMHTPDPDDPSNSKRILLTVGDSIDLFKLVMVDEGTALFERGSIQILLELKHYTGDKPNP